MEKMIREKFKANAIFLQPTFSCAKSCGQGTATGCYVKEKESRFSSDEMELDIWRELIDDLVIQKNNIHTRQITLALDTLPKTAARAKMKLIAEMYFEALFFMNPDDSDYEYHMTVNTVHDLIQYDPINLSQMSLVSISHLNNPADVEVIKNFFPKAKINYNVMAGDFVRQVRSKGLDQVKKLIQKVDSVYLLLSKAPMGLQGHGFNDFFSALETLKQFKNVEPVATDGVACAVPDLASKFKMDGCMVDAAKFNKTKFGCSSNISRFQIWPDGRVTGCAYNSHNQYGKFAESFEDVLDNLHDAKNRYEFESCSIPKDLVEYPKRKSLQVVNA